MAERLPLSLQEKGLEGEDVKVRYAQSIDLLSRYQWVRMCDGSMKQYPITYQVDEAQIVTVSDVDDVQDSLYDSGDMSDDHMLDNVYNGLTDEYEMDDDKNELSYVDQGTNADKEAENVADDEAYDEAGDNNRSGSSSEGASEYSMEDAEIYAEEYGENVTATNELSRFSESCA